MLGAEIRKARIAAGMTQERLAVRAGISREYVNMLEHDKYAPTVEVLLCLCEAMSVKASEIVGRIEELRALEKQQKQRRKSGAKDLR